MALKDELVAFVEFLRSQGNSNIGFAYVSRAEIAAMNDIKANAGGAFEIPNNTGLKVLFDTPLAKRLPVEVIVDLNAKFPTYVWNVSQTGFEFSVSYGASLQGVWYRINGTGGMPEISRADLPDLADLISTFDNGVSNGETSERA